MLQALSTHTNPGTLPYAHKELANGCIGVTLTEVEKELYVKEAVCAKTWVHGEACTNSRKSIHENIGPIFFEIDE